MSTRYRFALLFASMAAGLAGPSAHALSITPTDTLKVTDLAGNVLLDVHGHPAIGTISEDPGPPGSDEIVFEIDIPDIVPFSTAGVLQLLEEDPDPVTHEAHISDVVEADLFQSGPTFPALLVVALTGNPIPRPINQCQEIGVFTCLRETGGFQDVTAALFPFRTDFSFRIFVQSDPAPNPVPEPGTLALLGVGLAGLAGWGRHSRTA